jgi:hypothetical protein
MVRPFSTKLPTVAAKGYLAYVQVQLGQRKASSYLIKQKYQTAKLVS